MKHRYPGIDTQVSFLQRTLFDVPLVCSVEYVVTEECPFSCRFGEGYIITVRVQGDLPDLEPLYKFFSEKFPRAALKVGLVVNVYAGEQPSSGHEPQSRPEA